MHDIALLNYWIWNASKYEFNVKILNELMIYGRNVIFT